jgi:hypothetical protein
MVRSYPPLTTVMGGMRWHELLPGLVLFRLVAPPLQPGVVGPYPIRGVLYPGRKTSIASKNGH